MTYTPHVWSRHDKLDSIALNSLEQAVGAFSGTADEATAAQQAAAQSAQAAAASAALVGAPAGTAIDAHLGGDSTGLAVDAIKTNTDGVLRTIALNSALPNTVKLGLAQGLNGARWSMESSTKATGTNGMELQLIPDDAADIVGSTTEILLFHKTGPDYMRSVWHWVNNTLYFGTSAGGKGTSNPMVFQVGSYAPQNVAGFNAAVIASDGSVSLNGGSPTIKTGMIPANATIAAVAGDGLSATMSAAIPATAAWTAGVGHTTDVMVGATIVKKCTITAGSATITGTFNAGQVGSTISDQTAYAASCARISDDYNTGLTTLIIDTRTITPDATKTSDKSIIRFRRSGANKWAIGLNSGGANADSLDFAGGTGVVVLKLHSNGSLGMAGATANNTSLIAGGAGVIGIGNVTTAPSGNPVGGGVLYVSGGALMYKGSSGTVTTLGPA